MVGAVECLFSIRSKTPAKSDKTAKSVCDTLKDEGFVGFVTTVGMVRMFRSNWTLILVARYRWIRMVL